MSLQVAALVVKLGEQLQLPAALGLQVAEFQVEVDVAGLLGGELPQVGAVVGREVIVGPFVKPYRGQAQVLVGHAVVAVFFPLLPVIEFTGRLVQVEVLAAHLPVFDVGFPAVGTRLPDAALLRVAPAFAYVDHGVEPTDLLFHRKRTEFLPGGVVGAEALEGDAQPPFVQIEALIVERELGVHVRGLVAVKDLPVLFAVVPQVFRGVVHLQFPDLPGGRRRLLLLAFAHTGKVSVK